MHGIVLATLLLLSPQGKLGIKDVEIGKGAVAKAGDLLTVEYVGKLSTGKEFDSSKGRPPFSFTLGANLVIAGWDKGLVGMKVGGKRTLTIPPDLGYGAAGSPPAIPANATLKFDVRLLHLWKKGAAPKIQITELKPGKGRAVKAGDSVDVHYAGTFLNGVKFDSSIGGKPLAVTVGAGGVIPGFDQGIVGMNVGSKRKVIIPPELGYGVAGSGTIPPNATLVFELTLVKIK